VSVGARKRKRKNKRKPHPTLPLIRGGKIKILLQDCFDAADALGDGFFFEDFEKFFSP